MLLIEFSMKVKLTLILKTGIINDIAAPFSSIIVLLFWNQ